MQHSTLDAIRALRKVRMKEVLAMDFQAVQAAIATGDVSDEELQAWLLTRAFGYQAGPELDAALAKLP